MSDQTSANLVSVRTGRTPMTGDTSGHSLAQAYEDGKHRRYTLLFAVNGGAFAVAKLFVDLKTADVLGSLTLSQLSVGMILFTIVMVLDIYMFGEKMRTQYLPDAFGWQGKSVLLLLGILI